MGYIVRQTLSTELSAAPKSVPSMINLKTVASSADAKSVSMSCSEVSSPDPSYNTEKHVAHPAAKVCVAPESPEVLTAGGLGSH